MGIHFPSGLLAGVTSAVIWISVCLMTDVDAEAIGLWALVFLVLVTIVTIAISSMIARNRSAPRT